MFLFSIGYLVSRKLQSFNLHDQSNSLSRNKPLVTKQRRQFIHKQDLKNVTSDNHEVKNQIIENAANPKQVSQQQKQQTTPTTSTTFLTSTTLLTATKITTTTTTTTATNTTLSNSSCEAPSIAEFPSDLFSQYQRRHGAFVVHALVAIYMCIGLAIVCDYYFIPSLEVICYRLDLQADVAGASFMAIGSSAPELFASVIGMSRLFFYFTTISHFISSCNLSRYSFIYLFLAFNH